jgi:hypothetical protein
VFVWSFWQSWWKIYFNKRFSLVFTKIIIGLSKVKLFRIWENFFAHRYWWPRFPYCTLYWWHPPYSSIWYWLIFGLKDALHKFSPSSCLKVNCHKSNMVPINVSKDSVNDLAFAFRCQVTSFPFTYLWLPLGTTRPRIQDLTTIITTLERKLTYIFVSYHNGLDCSWWILLCPQCQFSSYALFGFLLLLLSNLTIS